jgi:hypothetical protein
MKIHATRRADFDEWWTSLQPRMNTLPPAVSKAVLDWLTAANVLPGKRFTGAYSREQLTLFQAIRDALDYKQIVNASTKTTFWRKYDRSGVEVKEGPGKAQEAARAGIFCQTLVRRGLSGKAGKQHPLCNPAQPPR